MTVPEVSVLLPFYNAAGTLERAIQSIVCQSYENWELVLIDNNGDAVSKDIAKKWTTKDNRVRVIHQPVQGIAHALNAGLNAAKASVIARMDADDESAKSRIEKQRAFLNRNPEIGLVGSQCLFESTSANAEGYRLFVEWQNNIVTPEDHLRNRFVESPLAHPTVMFRKALVELYGGYSTENGPEDYELWLRLMDRGVKMAKLPEALLTWHDNDQRLSRSHPNYSTKAFDDVKIDYLARWIKTNVDQSKRIVICGTGKNARERAAMLEQHGIVIWGYNDIKQRGVPSGCFMTIDDLGKQRDVFLINFISKRDVREPLRQLMLDRGYDETVDFILAA